MKRISLMLFIRLHFWLLFKHITFYAKRGNKTRKNFLSVLRQLGNVDVYITKKGTVYIG